jgi:hypothetical protein
MSAQAQFQFEMKRKAKPRPKTKSVAPKFTPKERECIDNMLVGMGWSDAWISPEVRLQVWESLKRKEKERRK